MDSLQKLKGVLETKGSFLFDMDGTLVDLEKLNYESYSYTLEKVFGLELNNDDYVKYFAGTRTVDAFSEYIEDKNLDVDLDNNEIIKLFRDYKSQKMKDDTGKYVELKAGSREYLRKLQSQGKNIALCTSAVRLSVDIIFDHFKLSDFFDIVITAEDVKNGKPSPEIYETCMNSLNTNSSESIVFEDSKNGIDAAKKAGVLCVGIRNEPWNKEFVTDADYVVDNFEQLAN